MLSTFEEKNLDEHILEIHKHQKSVKQISNYICSLSIVS